MEMLARLGWGASTDHGRQLALSPYGVSVALDVGYTWNAGFRLGGYLGYSLGRSVSQQYEPLVGRTIDLTADTSSLNAGISIGTTSRSTGSSCVTAWASAHRDALGFRRDATACRELRDNPAWLSPRAGCNDLAVRSV
jgi:hypothetical protein